MATNIEILKEDIATMQEVMDDSTVEQYIKDLIKKPLAEAQRQIGVIESNKS